MYENSTFIFRSVIFYYLVLISIDLYNCFDFVRYNNDTNSNYKDIIEALGMVLPPDFQRRIGCVTYSKQFVNMFNHQEEEICEFTSSKVFSSRKKELAKARSYIHHKSSPYYSERKFSKFIISNTTTPNSIYYRKSRHRVKRDRTLLAVQAEPKSDNRLWPKWCKKLAYFRVFQYDYTLCLYIKEFKDDAILAYSDPHLGITSYGYGSRKSFDKMTLLKKQKYVSGYVLGRPFSSVKGFVWNNRFYGSIYVKDTLLFVEPILEDMLVNFPMTYSKSRTKRSSVNAYVYKVYSRKLSTSKGKKKNRKNSKKHRTAKKRSRDNNYTKEKPRKKLKSMMLSSTSLHPDDGSKHYYGSLDNNDVCQSCGLLLMADYEYFRDVGEKSIEKTVHSMLYYIKEANSMLRFMNFKKRRKRKNEQKKSFPDCVGLHVSDIRIITSPHSSNGFLKYKNKKSKIKNYFWSWNSNKQSKRVKKTNQYSAFDRKYIGPEEYLTMFSRSHLDDHCLGILFSNRVFVDRILGLAWKGDPKKKSGICQKRTQKKKLKGPYHQGFYDKRGNEKEDLNLNALFITLRTDTMTRIPLRMAVLNLVHEILHSFGAEHDPADKHGKRKKHYGGRYLMSQYSNSGIRENHSKLSPKSKKAVQKILSDTRMTYCLHEIDNRVVSFCGDGVVQAGEECDCGSTEDCLVEKSCCIPSGGGPKEQDECTFATRKYLLRYCKADRKEMKKLRNYYNYKSYQNEILRP